MVYSHIHLWYDIYEWLNDFMSFYTWAMNNGYRDNLTIDRIDNNILLAY